ncbi:MAG: CPBP family intramembrane glutamic endopeptidase [Rubrobacteraceae bacterium]
MPPPENPQAASSTSERVYEKLLSACPEDFKEDHGPQMAQAFGDLAREERHSGKFGSMKLWVKTLPDLASTIILERNRSGATLNLQPWRGRINGIDVVTAFVLSLVLSLVLGGIFAAVSSYIYPDVWTTSGPLPLAGFTAIVLLLSLGMICTIALMTRAEGTNITWQSIGMRRVSRWWLFVGASLGITCWAIASLAGALYFWITGKAFYSTNDEFLSGFSEASFMDLVFFWAAVGLLGSLANELLLRGILYTYFRRWGLWVAVFFSAVLSGLMLFGFSLALSIGIMLGVVLALVYERSGSLWPAVTCAIAINTLGTLFGGLTLF